MTTYQVEFPESIGRIKRVQEYPSLGFCIYCRRGNVRLYPEHIIPHGIAGDAFILLEGSCRPCGNMTGRFEQSTLRHAWWPFRSKLGAPTSKPKDRPKLFTLRDARINLETGKPEITGERQVPLNEFPTSLVAMQFPEPGLIAGRPHTFNIEGSIWRTIGEPEKHALSPGEGLQLGRFHPGEFCRMLAKIAHSYASAVYRELFKPSLRKIIKGNLNSATFWIGGVAPLAPPDNGILHKVGHQIVAKDGKSYVVVSLRLFAFMGTPEYLIVAGEFLGRDDQIIRPK